MAAAGPKLLLQLELPHPTVCPPCCSCSHYLNPCSNDPSSSCLSCRKLRAPCQRQAFLYRPNSCPYLHQSPCAQSLSCRHSHPLHEASCGCCRCSSMSDLAGASPKEEESAHACGCSRHSQAVEASYFCSSTRNNVEAPVFHDQPMITIATICKTAPPQPADPGHGGLISCSKPQEEIAAEMRWWEGGRLKGSSSYGEEAAERPLHCYTWPPRAYACTFCRRMFVSAQALGGHMNVHRHERARLRQFSQPNIAAANAEMSHTAPNTLPLLPDNNNFMHGDKPCFNYTSNPIMISSSNFYDTSLSSALQHGLQATKKDEARREKLFNERREIDLPINPQMNAHFFIDGQSKQEVSYVDLELRLGHLASN